MFNSIKSDQALLVSSEASQSIVTVIEFEFYESPDIK